MFRVKHKNSDDTFHEIHSGVFQESETGPKVDKNDKGSKDNCYLDENKKGTSKSNIKATRSATDANKRALKKTEFKNLANTVSTKKKQKPKQNEHKKVSLQLKQTVCTYSKESKKTNQSQSDTNLSDLTSAYNLAMDTELAIEDDDQKYLHKPDQNKTLGRFSVVTPLFISKHQSVNFKKQVGRPSRSIAEREEGSETKKKVTRRWSDFLEEDEMLEAFTGGRKNIIGTNLRLEQVYRSTRRNALVGSLHKTESGNIRARESDEMDIKTLPIEEDHADEEGMSLRVRRQSALRDGIIFTEFPNLKNTSPSITPPKDPVASPRRKRKSAEISLASGSFSGSKTTESLDEGTKKLYRSPFKEKYPKLSDVPRSVSLPLVPYNSMDTQVSVISEQSEPRYPLEISHMFRPGCKERKVSFPRISQTPSENSIVFPDMPPNSIIDLSKHYRRVSRPIRHLLKTPFGNISRTPSDSLDFPLVPKNSTSKIPRDNPPRKEPWTAKPMGCRKPLPDWMFQKMVIRRKDMSGHAPFPFLSARPSMVKVLHPGFPSRAASPQRRSLTRHFPSAPFPLLSRIPSSSSDSRLDPPTSVYEGSSFTDYKLAKKLAKLQIESRRKKFERLLRISRRAGHAEIKKDGLNIVPTPDNLWRFGGQRTLQSAKLWSQRAKEDIPGSNIQERSNIESKAPFPNAIPATSSKSSILDPFPSLEDSYVPMRRDKSKTKNKYRNYKGVKIFPFKPFKYSKYNPNQYPIMKPKKCIKTCSNLRNLLKTKRYNEKQKLMSQQIRNRFRHVESRSFKENTLVANQKNLQKSPDIDNKSKSKERHTDEPEIRYVSNMELITDLDTQNTFEKEDMDPLSITNRSIELNRDLDSITKSYKRHLGQPVITNKSPIESRPYLDVKKKSEKKCVDQLDVKNRSPIQLKREVGTKIKSKKRYLDPPKKLNESLAQPKRDENKKSNLYKRHMERSRSRSRSPLESRNERDSTPETEPEVGEKSKPKRKACRHKNTSFTTTNRYNNYLQFMQTSKRQKVTTKRAKYIEKGKTFNTYTPVKSKKEETDDREGIPSTVLNEHRCNTPLSKPEDSKEIPNLSYSDSRNETNKPVLTNSQGSISSYKESSKSRSRDRQHKKQRMRKHKNEINPQHQKEDRVKEAQPKWNATSRNERKPTSKFIQKSSKRKRVLQEASYPDFQSEKVDSNQHKAVSDIHLYENKIQKESNGFLRGRNPKRKTYSAIPKHTQSIRLINSGYTDPNQPLHHWTFKTHSTKRSPFPYISQSPSSNRSHCVHKCFVNTPKSTDTDYVSSFPNESFSSKEKSGKAFDGVNDDTHKKGNVTDNSYQTYKKEISGKVYKNSGRYEQEHQRENLIFISRPRSIERDKLYKINNKVNDEHKKNEKRRTSQSKTEKVIPGTPYSHYNSEDDNMSLQKSSKSKSYPKYNKNPQYKSNETPKKPMRVLHSTTQNNRPIQLHDCQKYNQSPNTLTCSKKLPFQPIKMEKTKNKLVTPQKRVKQTHTATIPYIENANSRDSRRTEKWVFQNSDPRGYFRRQRIYYTSRSPPKRKRDTDSSGGSK